MEENHKNHGEKIAEIHFDGFKDGYMHTHVEGNGATLLAMMAQALEDARFRELVTAATALLICSKEDENKRTTSQVVN